MQCRGFLFDLDGTLVDSLPVVERSWCHWADRHGIDHQDVLNFIHGKQAITSRHKAAGLPTPDVFITAERVKRGKPEPDAFLLGAELLGLDPAECVVVEDAAAGVLAGLNAGSHVIAVNVPAESPRLDEADLVLDSLTALSVSKASDGVVTVSLKM